MYLWSQRNRVILIFIMLIVLFTFIDWAYYRERIYPGVYFKSIHLGGKSWQEAINLLLEYEVTFELPEGRLVPSRLSKLGIHLIPGIMIENAFEQGRSQPWPLSYLDRIKLMRQSRRLPAVYELQQEEFMLNTSKLSAALEEPPLNATIHPINRKITIYSEKAGYRLLEDKFQDAIVKYLNSPQQKSTVKIPVELIQPDITVEFLQKKKIQAVRGTFTTIFDASQEERSHNIRLAAKQLHNRLVEPGEVFSLNNIIGDTTPEKGYKKAPIIVGEELIPGYGGGLCQVSTTLYNAVLLAGLKITERYPHGMAVPYVPPGRDATIAYSGKDLKFKNTTDQAVLIIAGLTETDLTFSILGIQQSEEINIETKLLQVFRPSTKRIFDPTFPAGKEILVEGEPGYLVEVRRIFTENGEMKYSELLSVDRYASYPIVIRHGP